jgi:hypothetical protein
VNIFGTVKEVEQDNVLAAFFEVEAETVLEVQTNILMNITLYF